MNDLTPSEAGRLLASNRKWTKKARDKQRLIMAKARLHIVWTPERKKMNKVYLAKARKAKALKAKLRNKDTLLNSNGKSKEKIEKETIAVV